VVAGCAVGYKTKFQQAVALSSTEAEWVAAWEIGKTVLYFRSLFEDLGQPQHSATTLYKDKRGALFMANQQQASNRTQHIDIKHVALIDWVEQDLMLLAEIISPENCSDAMTMALAHILFYWHNDTNMGRRIPAHFEKYIPNDVIRCLTLLQLFLGTHSCNPKNRGGKGVDIRERDYRNSDAFIISSLLLLHYIVYSMRSRSPLIDRALLHVYYAGPSVSGIRSLAKFVQAAST
jgi:hypothetical protein